MYKFLLIIASAFLYSAPSFAVEESPAFEGTLYPVAAYHEDQFYRAGPTAWNGHDRLYGNEWVKIEAEALHYSLDREAGAWETSIGMGLAPYYTGHGVFRTRSSGDEATYIAIGFVLDELIDEETSISDSRSDSALSYGFGVNRSSYNIEYMMSLDEEDFDLSTVSVGFSTEF